LKNYNLFLKGIAEEKGITLFGVCATEGLKDSFHREIKENLSTLSYAISLGYKLSKGVLSTIKDVPSLLYKNHYKTVNWILDQTVEKLANVIQKEGKTAIAIPSSQIVEWEKQTGHLSHILIGQKCGLGWIGRSGLLVNPEHGAQVRYATILTDIPLEIDNPIDKGCEDCKKCIDACPAGAISEKGYDKEKCMEKIKEFTRIKGIGVGICGICIRACNGNVTVKAG
jgi:epoxyqueuosine reductase